MMLSDWLARTRAPSGVLSHQSRGSVVTYTRRKFQAGLTCIGGGLRTSCMEFPLSIIRTFRICAASSRRVSASSHDSQDNNNVIMFRFMNTVRQLGRMNPLPRTSVDKQTMTKP